MLSVKQGDIKYHFLSLWYDNLELNPGPSGKKKTYLFPYEISFYINV